MVVEALAPKKDAMPQAATFVSRYSVDLLSEASAVPVSSGEVPKPADASVPLQARSRSDPRSHGDGLTS